MFVTKMNYIKCVLLFVIVTLLCSCDELGIVKKSRLDAAVSEIERLNAELEQVNSQINVLKREKEDVESSLTGAQGERDKYLSTLKIVCNKSEQLDRLINSNDYISFDDLKKAVEELRESLGYIQVYSNSFSQPFQSQKTTVTGQPDYLFN